MRSRPWPTAGRLISAALVASLLVPAVTAPASATPAADPAVDQPAARLVNDELVVADLGPSGLPTSATLIDRLSATGLPEKTYKNPTSTTDITYVGQRGSPQTTGSDALITVGGPIGSVTTQATFGKPLPVALHAEYERAGQAVAPDSVTGASGEMKVTYTLTNTTVKDQTITYRDAQGVEHSEKKPVFAPFAGTLRIVLAPGQRLLSAPGAVLETTREGRSQATWNLVLYPPLGDYTQRYQLRIAADSLQVPPARMEVVPVTSSEDAAVGFSTGMLDETLKGNKNLAEGLGDIDESTLKIARGTAELTAGLLTLQDSSQQLATGLNAAQQGSSSLTSGLAGLSDGLTQLTAGLDTLAGPKGLPVAVETSAALAEAVRKIAAVIGSPSDPVVDPLPPGATLYQVARATAAGSAELDAKLRELADALTAVAATEMAEVSTAAATVVAKSFAANASLIAGMTQLCAVLPPPPGCSDLQQAMQLVADAGAAGMTAAQSNGVATAKVQFFAAGATQAADGAKLINTAVVGIQDGLAQVSAALQSGNPQAPGVYEGLIALTAGLTVAAVTAERLAVGAQQSTTGAEQLTSGSGELTDSLGDASSGAQQLTDGTSQLAQGSSDVSQGASELQQQGTSKIYTQVVESSKQPAFARAYLVATDKRTTDAMPYGAPAGATGRVAYVYQLASEPQEDSVNWGLIGALALVLVAVAYLGWRRVSGIAAAPVAAAAPAALVAGPAAAPTAGGELVPTPVPGTEDDPAENADGQLDAPTETSSPPDDPEDPDDMIGPVQVDGK